MATTAGEPPSGARKQILYVDSHEDSRQLLSWMLEAQGFAVVTAGKSAEAMRLAQRQRFDLFILETWMPEVSGLDLCRQLRAFDATTPILFFSSATTAAFIQAGLAAGAQRYLTKPADLEIIREVVTQLLRGGQ